MEEEKITFDNLLESEKNAIENKIYENVAAPKNENEIKESGDVKNLKGKTKTDLIEDLQNLEKATGLEITDAKKLKRWTKQELLKRIGDILSGSVQVVDGEGKKKEDKPFSQGEEDLKPINPESLKDDINICANALYRMNLMVSALLENTSVALKDKTGGIPVLSGFCGKLEEQKPIMIDLFKDIYLKYKDELKTVVSPLSQYGIIMGTTAMSVASENLAKKKMQSTEN